MTNIGAARAWLTRSRSLRGWEWVLLMFVFSRVLIFAVIAVAREVFVRGNTWHPGGVFSVLLQWDAELWYVSIARNGYTYSPDFPSSMGFFPFYPLIIRAFSFVWHDYRVAAVVAAHVFFIAAALLLNALINVDYDDRRINRAAITFLMFSPVSFFFSNAYTESTFLMLSIGAFLAARRRQWFIACLFGGCLTATRNVGALIGPALLLEYLHQNWRPFPRNCKALLHPRILWFWLIPMGLGGFMLYGYLKFDNAFAYMDATKVWGRHFVMPWVTLRNVGNLTGFYQLLFDFVLFVGTLIWFGGFLFGLRASYLVYSTLLVGVYYCGNSLEAIPRYLSVVFPLFITLGLLARRYEWTYVPLLAGSTALLTLCTILSAMGYWMT